MTIHPPKVEDADLKVFLDDVVGAVEANTFETLSLWREYTEELKQTWTDNLAGYVHTIGQYADRPICLSLLTSVVNGHKILFYHPTSQLVDYALVEKWLDDVLPGKPKVNAMNFCNVFHR